MARHAGARLSRPDRELNAALRANWPLLPRELRDSSHRIATVRLGVAAFAVMVLVGALRTAIASTPAEFADHVASPGPYVTMMALAAVAVVITRRAMTRAPAFVAAYLEMMPDADERMTAAFGERGPGDLVAPWIRTRPGNGSRLLRGIGRRIARAIDPTARR